MGYKTETHRHRPQCGGHQREGVGGRKGKGGQTCGDGRWLDLGGGHTVQYTDHVPQKPTLETYGLLLANVTPINLIEKLKQ